MTDSPAQLVIGKINGVYGIKGWIKVYSYTDPLDQILEYQPWLLRKGNKQMSLTLEAGQLHGKGLIALPEGFQTRNDAETLIGYEVWVDKDRLPKLDEDEFYWHELEGMVVVNQADEILGEVSHLMETGANDVLVVRESKDSIDDRERIIPFVMDKVILGIDRNARQMRVAWDKSY